MATISQTIFSDTFWLMKSFYQISLKFIPKDAIDNK